MTVPRGIETVGAVVDADGVGGVAAIVAASREIKNNDRRIEILRRDERSSSIAAALLKPLNLYMIAMRDDMGYEWKPRLYCMPAKRQRPK
jgi:hypothetical protein